MKTLSTLLGAALLAGALAAHADESPDRGPMRGHRMQDCSKAEDQAACEARRDKMRQAMRDAREACQGKERAERRQCMVERMCAQSPDPAQCNARAKERAELRSRMLEACKGKEGAEMRSCLREQRREHRHERHGEREPATS